MKGNGRPIWDRDTHPNIWALYAVVGTGFIAIVRILRTVWTLELVIELLTKPTSSSTAEAA